MSMRYTGVAQAERRVLTGLKGRPELNGQTVTVGDFNAAKERYFVENNILRLMGGAWKWNMCQNFAWQLCAATGRLPGQDGAKLHFATAPKAMRIEEWRRPTSWPCDNGEPCPPGKYAVGDVYFAELAVYRYICSNADELFKVGDGELTRCVVDERAYHVGTAPGQGMRWHREDLI